MSMNIAVTAAREAAPHAPIVLRGPLDVAIREAAAIGYDAVELHLPDPAEVNPDEILVVCQQTGIRISSIGTGLAFVRDGLSLTHPDDLRRREAQSRMGRFIDLANRLQCVVIVGLMKGQVRELANRDKYLEIFTLALASLLDMAAAKGVTLVLEAVNRYESDIFNTIAETCSFIGSFHSRWLKLHIDTFHMNMEEDRIAENIRLAGKLVGHVHLADSNRRFPGAGHYDFPATLAALRDIGYDGTLAVECLAWPTPGEAAEGALRYLKDVLRDAGRANTT